MFISIKIFLIDERDNFTHISITSIDSNGEPEQAKKFDRKTDYQNGEWIQAWLFKTPNSMIVPEREMRIYVMVNETLTVVHWQLVYFWSKFQK